jgi:uncharacterized protein YjbI with pentapeptide repeats
MTEQKSGQAAGEKKGRKPWTLREFGGKTAWDWLQLLVVPLMLALLTVVFTQQQDETLQAYLDQMSTLLLARDLRQSQEDGDVRRLARARTLVVLDVLDSPRQNRVLRFLEETQLIQARPDRPPIISLKYVSLRDFELIGKQLLRGTDLTQAGLIRAELSQTHLEGTNLSLAHLGKADLRGAHLNGAKLNGTYLYDTNLRGADMSGADLSDAEGRFNSGARMIRTLLVDADLSGTDLRGANLRGANLKGAVITNAQVTEEQLREAESLEGATMPNGQKYEDWPKDKEDRRK